MIAGDTAVYDWQFSPRTPSGTYRLSSVFVKSVEGVSLYDGGYTFDVFNENGVASEPEIVDWSLTNDGDEFGGAFDFSITLRDLTDGVARRYPNASNDSRLAAYVHLKFGADDDYFFGRPFSPSELTAVAADEYTYRCAERCRRIVGLLTQE